MPSCGNPLDDEPAATAANESHPPEGLLLGRYIAPNAGAPKTMPTVSPKCSAVAQQVADRVRTELARQRAIEARHAALAELRAEIAQRRETRRPHCAEKATTAKRIPLVPVNRTPRPRARGCVHPRRSSSSSNTDDGPGEPARVLSLLEPPGDAPAALTCAELVGRFEVWRPGCTRPCGVPGRHVADCPVCDRPTARIIDIDGVGVARCIAGCSHEQILNALGGVA